MLFNKFPSNYTLHKAIEKRATLSYNDPKRKEYDQIVNDEYKEAFRIEDEFLWQWKGGHYIRTLKEAKYVVNNLCAKFGFHPVRDIKPYPTDNRLGAGAGCYSAYNTTIYIRDKFNIPLRVIIHELTHHIVDWAQNISFREVLRSAFKERVHGELFIREEKKLFDYLLSIQDKQKDTIYRHGYWGRDFDVGDLILTKSQKSELCRRY